MTERGTVVAKTHSQQALKLDIRQKIQEAFLMEGMDWELCRRGTDNIMNQINTYCQTMAIQAAELSRVALQLEMTKERYKSLFDSAPIGYVVYNKAGQLRIVNRQFCDMFGIPEGKGDCYTFQDFVEPRCQEALSAMSERVLRTGKAESIEIRMKGAERTIDATVTSNLFVGSEHVLEDIEFTGGDPLVRSVICDITELKLCQKEIMESSLRDSLTGLYNRRYYNDLIPRLDGETLCLPLSVAMIDIDGLKLINDSLGHVYGDRAIIAVARALREHAAPGYRLIRTGGDEIIVIFPNTEETEASAYMRQAEQQVESCELEGIRLSFSWGIASKRTAGDDLLSVIASAEDSMYSKKLYRSADKKADTVSIIVQTLFSRNELVKRHCMRVAVMAEQFGRLLGMSDYKVDYLCKLGYLHDIGLIAISDEIINKAGLLSDTERREMQRHSEVGFRILRPVAGMAEYANGALFHHEHWDGNGYPYSLAGEEIPREARIIAIVDAFDRMKYGRDGKGGISDMKILEEFQAWAGRQFDPELAQTFLSLFLPAWKNSAEETETACREINFL